jgi:hypothetical protein
MICRRFISALGEGIDRDLQSHVGSFTAENLVAEAVELLTIRTARPAAIAAELYFKA